jgi:hypothetical protein
VLGYYCLDRDGDRYPSSYCRWWCQSDDPNHPAATDGANPPEASMPYSRDERWGECDDTNADSHPGAEEVCDGRDNDCDGYYDDERPGDGPYPGSRNWCPDLDCDGHGNMDSSTWIFGCESSAPFDYIDVCDDPIDEPDVAPCPDRDHSGAVVSPRGMHAP